MPALYPALLPAFSSSHSLTEKTLVDHNFVNLVRLAIELINLGHIGMGRNSINVVGYNQFLQVRWPHFVIVVMCLNKRVEL